MTLRVLLIAMGVALGNAIYFHAASYGNPKEVQAALFLLPAGLLGIEIGWAVAGWLRGTSEKSNDA